MTKKNKPVQTDLDPSSALQIIRNKTELLPSFEIQDNPADCLPEYSKLVVDGSGKIIYYGDDSTRILSPSSINDAIERLHELKIPHTLKMVTFDPYSVQAIFTIKSMQREITKGDILEACFVYTCSGNQMHKNGIDISIDRLICGNGLRRQQTDLNAGPELINLTLAHLEGQLASFRPLLDKKLRWSEVQNPLFSEKFTNVGFSSKDVETAHHFLSLESELNNDLNAWLVYNAFNKALFESPTKMPYQKRKSIDDKIFEICSN